MDLATHSPAAAQAGEFAQSVLAAMREVLGPATATIGLHEPEFGGNEWAYVKDCLDTGWVSSHSRRPPASAS